MKKFSGILLFLFSILFFAEVGAQVPELQGRVNDYANVLSQQEEMAIEQLLEDIEAYEGNPQIVVLTISSVPRNGSIEEYSIDVARTWGIGQRDRDNGLLITILTDSEDFTVRFETGYGLEGALPDARIQAIYNETMRPHFQTPGSEEYFTALQNGIETIAVFIRGEETGNSALDSPDEGSLPWWVWLIIIIVILLLFFFVAGEGGGGGSGWSGGSSSSSGWGSGSGGFGGGGGGFGGGGFSGGR